MVLGAVVDGWKGSRLSVGVKVGIGSCCAGGCGCGAVGGSRVVPPETLGEEVEAVHFG